MKKIGFITSGGDAPGMNAAIRAIVKSCLYNQCVPVGFFDGFQGLVDARYKEFTYKDVNNIVHVGGTILSSSRSDEFMTKEGRKKVYDNLQEIGVEGLVVIGGDGSIKGGEVFSNEYDFPIVGVPATIDNDVYGTDYTIGFDTALNTVVESIDKLRDTANSHHRMFFVEVMGRHSGYIALRSAIASGAEMVLLPEKDMDFRKLALDLCSMNKGERGSMFVVAEGGVTGGVERLIERLRPFVSGFDVRTVVLGHVQRGGKPTASDRILATKLGNAAVEELLKGGSRKMIGFVNNQLAPIAISEAVAKSHEIYEEELNLLKKMLTESY